MVMLIIIILIFLGTLSLILTALIVELADENHKLKEKMIKEEGYLRPIRNLPIGREFERVNESYQAIVTEVRHCTEDQNETEDFDENFICFSIGVCSPEPIPKKFRIEKPRLYNEVIPIDDPPTTSNTVRSPVERF